MARTNHNSATSSIIGSDARLEGILTLDGAIRIDGKFTGVLVCGGTVTIGRNSEIEGDITAEEVILGGRVVGTLVAKSRLALESAASLKGEVATCALVIEEGAGFSGISNMGKEAVDKLLHKQQKSNGKVKVKNTDKFKGIVLYNEEEEENPKTQKSKKVS